MTHEYVLWIATAAYLVHILEEYELNWRDWARAVLGLPLNWDTFYVVNALVAALGACCAMVGWKRPEFALAFPGIMVVNATFFHVLPMLKTRVYSPGVVSAIFVFYPVAGWAYYGAWVDGVLGPWEAAASGILAVVLKVYLIAIIKIKHHPMFRYESLRAAAESPAGIAAGADRHPDRVPVE
jgi:hypothetical protein